MEPSRFRGPTNTSGPRKVQDRAPYRSLTFGLVAAMAFALAGTGHARAEAKLLIEAATGKVLHAENATQPWYPASVTKLMTTYTTLRAIKEGRLRLDTLITVSRNAAAQNPVKMGFKIGTQPHHRQRAEDAAGEIRQRRRRGRSPKASADRSAASPT